jgi:hypothetical protein
VNEDEAPPIHNSEGGVLLTHHVSSFFFLFFIFSFSFLSLILFSLVLSLFLFLSFSFSLSFSLSLSFLVLQFQSLLHPLSFHSSPSSPLPPRSLSFPSSPNYTLKYDCGDWLGCGVMLEREKRKIHHLPLLFLGL